MLFNLFGYRFYTGWLQQRADQQLQSRIDANDYDETQLLEIRIALNMPYQNNQSDFERYYGEAEVNGRVYTYVKRKIEDGYLILKCLPNHEKQVIRSANNIFFSINNGLDENTGKSPLPSTHNIKNFFSDFDDHIADFKLPASAMSNNGTGQEKSELPSLLVPVNEQPPDFFVLS